MKIVRHKITNIVPYIFNDTEHVVIDGFLQAESVRAFDITDNEYEIVNGSSPHYPFVGNAFTFSGAWEIVDNTYALKLKQAHAEEVIQSHINSFVISRGYDNANSIAKYLVVGNPFYEECSALSLWVGAVWVKAHEVMSQVLGGTLAEPTDEELVAMMPVFGE